VPVPSRDSLLEALRRAVECFQSGRIPYVLIGAWALAIWGRPRATLDLDFLVLLSEEDLGHLSSRMIRAGMDRDDVWLKYNPMLRGLQLRLGFRGVTVDLLRPRDAHDRQVFRRKRKKRLESNYYWFVAPEDFILQKLKVGRPRDFEDALSVLERSGKDLDVAYLRGWARRIAISGELNYLLSL